MASVLRLLREAIYETPGMLKSVVVTYQGEHTTLFHVTWRHMALLSQDQLYELANKLCVRLGNLQKVLPCYRSALNDYSVMVRAAQMSMQRLVCIPCSSLSDQAIGVPVYLCVTINSQCAGRKNCECCIFL